jgi:hypothetical protein
VSELRRPDRRLADQFVARARERTGTRHDKGGTEQPGGVYRRAPTATTHSGRCDRHGVSTLTGTSCAGSNPRQGSQNKGNLRSRWSAQRLNHQQDC